MVTQQRLRELFSYDPNEGKLRLLGPRKAKAAGEIAGFDNGNGYFIVTVDGRGYLEHRLVWLMVHGTMPEFIDHKNLSRSDNRLANLRASTRSENAANARTRPHNKLGIKGVYYRQGRGYEVSLTKDRKTIHIGRFSTPQEAKAAYDAAAQRFHGDFARSA